MKKANPTYTRCFVHKRKASFDLGAWKFAYREGTNPVAISFSWNTPVYGSNIVENLSSLILIVGMSLGSSRKRSSMSLNDVSVYSGCGDDGSSMIGSQLLLWYFESRLTSREETVGGLSAWRAIIKGSVELPFFVEPGFFSGPGKASLALYQTCTLDTYHTPRDSKLQCIWKGL